MNKLTALIEAANAATPGPWSVEHQTCFVSLVEAKCFTVSADMASEDADYVALANPVTILELCALLEKAEEGFVILRGNGKGCAQWVLDTIDENLAAIKQWKEQT